MICFLDKLLDSMDAPTSYPIGSIASTVRLLLPKVRQF